MASKVINCSVIGVALKNFRDMHVRTATVYGHAVELQTRGFEIRWFDWRDLPRSGNVLIWPGFQAPGGKAIKSTKELLISAGHGDIKMVMLTADTTNLREWWRFAEEVEAAKKIGLCTNFLKPEAVWLTDMAFNEFSPWQPTAMIHRTLVGLPKVELGYVGRPKPERWPTLATLDLDMTMIGIGTDKQDKFPYHYSEGATFEYLGELYGHAAFHYHVTDPEYVSCQGAPTRMWEAWHCGRPVIVHPSVLYSRLDVDWTKMTRFIASTQTEVDHIVSAVRRGRPLDDPGFVSDLAKLAKFQYDAIFHQYYRGSPTVDKMVEFFSA